MEPSLSPAVTKKLLHIMRAVSFAIRKGIVSKRKLFLSLQLPLKSIKISCKAIICSLMITFKNHHPAMHVNKRWNHPCYCESWDNEAAAAVVRAFEMLNEEESASDAGCSIVNSPLRELGKSPMMKVRQLAITDSPFPVNEGEVVDGRVDRDADQFIRRFYNQLRTQQRIAMTPKHELHR